MPPRVLVVGHVTHDRYGDDLVPGGCAYYGAMAHLHLGAELHLAATVGADFRLDASLVGLPCSLRREGETTIFTNLYPKDAPRIQVLEALAPEVRPADVDPSWLSAGLVHLAPVLGEVDLDAWKRASRARVLAFTVQGFIKEGGPSLDRAELAPIVGEEAAERMRGRRVVQKRWDVSLDTLRGFDAVCVGDEDLIDQGDLLERLRAAIPIVALTHGKRGCEIFHDGRVTRVGIYPDAREVDVTGAGDTFAAGFLYGLADGASVAEAARLGAATASIAIEGRGDASLSRLPEARARVLEVPVLGSEAIKDGTR